MVTQKEVHIFDNKVKVYKDQLIPVQIERYKHKNLHEPEEEEWFISMLMRFSEVEKPTFIDIGPAIGYYAILSKLLVSNIEIIVYEPLMQHQEYLLENWKLNGLSINHLTIKGQAIYSKKKEMVFKNQHYGSRVLEKKNVFVKKMISKLTKEDMGEFIVNAVTLDEELSPTKKAQIVKIDVQGAEIEVLKGARKSMERKGIESFIIGTHGNDIHKSCLNILKNNEYKIIYENANPPLQPDGIIVASVD